PRKAERKTTSCVRSISSAQRGNQPSRKRARPAVGKGSRGKSYFTIQPQRARTDAEKESSALKSLRPSASSAVNSSSNVNLRARNRAMGVGILRMYQKNRPDRTGKGDATG